MMSDSDKIRIGSPNIQTRKSVLVEKCEEINEVHTSILDRLEILSCCILRNVSRREMKRLNVRSRRSCKRKLLPMSCHDHNVMLDAGRESSAMTRAVETRQSYRKKTNKLRSRRNKSQEVYLLQEVFPCLLSISVR